MFIYYYHVTYIKQRSDVHDSFPWLQFQGGQKGTSKQKEGGKKTKVELECIAWILYILFKKMWG